MNRPLTELAEIIVLQGGAHETPQEGVCVNELTAWIAGEKHGHSPECASPVVARFLMGLNDRMPDDVRQRLAPYAVRQIGTRGTPEQERERGFLCADWAVRVAAPMALRAAGRHAEADYLTRLNPVVDAATAHSARNAAFHASYARTAASYATAAAANAAFHASYASYATAAAAAFHAAHAANAASSAAVWDGALELADRLIAVTGSALTPEVVERAVSLRERIAVGV